MLVVLVTAYELMSGAVLRSARAWLAGKEGRPVMFVVGDALIC